ncbi:hypothetical protein GCM10022140_19770 [Rhodococcus aetherivorans]
MGHEADVPVRPGRIRMEYLPTRAVPVPRRNPRCMNESFETWDAMSKELPKPYAAALRMRAGAAGDEPLAGYVDPDAPEGSARIAEAEPDALQVWPDGGAPLLW